MTNTFWVLGVSKNDNGLTSGPQMSPFTDTNSGGGGGWIWINRNIRK